MYTFLVFFPPEISVIKTLKPQKLHTPHSELRSRGFVLHNPNLNLFLVILTIFNTLTLPLFFFFFFVFVFLKVKIWFQNKRSKYKKIMKHGPTGPEGELQAGRAHAQSPCSPVPPVLWDAPMAGKSAHAHPGGYMNSFGQWYPSSQDTLPRPHMM